MVVIYQFEGHLLFVGDDKFENDGLIKYSQRYMSEMKTPVYWFHVDNFSSPHAYVRLNEGETKCPPKLVALCSQIVKNGSIEGSKRPATDVIYTLCTNLAKTKQLNVGTVTFVPGAEILYNRAVRHDKMLTKVLEKCKSETTIPAMEKELDDLIKNSRKKKPQTGKKAADSDDWDDFDEKPKKQTLTDTMKDMDQADSDPCDSDDFM